MKRAKTKMKSLFLFVIGLAASAGPAACARASAQTAKELVQQFVIFDVEGKRLTPEGWYKADALFARASQPSPNTNIVVIATHYAVSEATNGLATTEFYMGYEEIGRVDSSLRFVPSAPKVQTRTMQKYNVVRTEKANGSVKWKIEGSQPTEMHLIPEAAIRYLVEMRGKANDSTVRKNASQAIAALRKYE